MQSGTHRWRVIGAVATVFVLSAALTPRLRMDEDITAMLPDTDPVVNNYRLIATNFHAVDDLYIDVGIVSDKPDAEAYAIAVADRLHEHLQQLGLFKEICYRTPPEHMLKALETLTTHRARLLSDRDLSAVAERLTPGAIGRRLAAAKRALIESLAPFFCDQIRCDPLGIDEPVLAGLKGLAREGGGTAQIVDGRIQSKDGKHILMVATPRFRAMDTKRGEGVVAAVEAARAEALRAAPGGDVRISFVGGHRSAFENASTIKGDVKRTMLATSIAILVLAILFFRRPLFIALVFLPAAFGMACSVTVFGLLDPLISAVVIGCGAVLIGIAVDYGVHVLYRLDNPEGEPLEPKACVRSMLLPLLMGSCTTIGGLLCLLFSSLPGQRQTGLFAAVGILGAVGFAVLALPHFLPRGPQRRRKRVIPLASYCRALLAWRARHRKLAVVALLAALAVGVVGLPSLRFEGDVESLNYNTPGNRSDIELIQQVWRDSAPTVVGARGPELEDALEANDRLFPTLEALKQEGKIASLSSLAPILPSAKTQGQNHRRWKAFWSDERRAAVKAEMKKAGDALGFSAAAFQPFHESLEGSEKPLKRADFEGTALDRLIGSRIVRKDGEVFVFTMLSIPGELTSQEVLARIRSVLPGAVIWNGKEFGSHMTRLVRAQLGKLIIIAAIVMAFCLYLFLGRVELVITALLPICFSMLLTLGLLGLFGVPVNLIGSLFVVFAFGVGLDYSIFLLSTALARHRGRESHEATTYGSVLICAMTTMCGFVAMIFARHPALFSIGVTGTIGMASSLFCSVLMVPMMADWLLPGERREGTPSLKTIGGALWAFVYLAGPVLFYVCVLRFVIMLRYRRDPAARARFARRFAHLGAAGLLRFSPYRDSRRIYIGAEPEAFRPPGVIVSNHLAPFDIMVVLALPTEMAMVVKSWVWKAPLMGRLVRDAGFVLAEPGDSEAVLVRGARLLEQGVPVMVFPESTRSPDGRMRRFHMGAFELAVRTGSDIVPVVLSNTQSCTPRRAFWVGDHQCVIRVLPRVTPQAFDYRQGARALARHVKEKMVAVQHADWRLAQDGKSFWHNIRSLYGYRGVYAERYIRWKLRLDPIFRHVDELIPEEGAVLDLGCGYGLMSNILARKSLRRQVLGVDFDERKIAVARGTAAGALNLKFELRDLFEWDFPPADAVVLVDVLHYWRRDGQRRIISKAATCLGRGGTVLFRDVCRTDTWRHRITAWSERFSTASGHNRPGQGLHFADRDFYVQAFAEEGLELDAEPPDLAPGSDVVMVFRKGT